MAFPKLKLTYFDMAGRAEAARLAFFIGNVPFEDDRFPREDISPRKHEFPYGVIPVLQVDGETLGESSAIARYAGRLAGLYPRNNAVAAVLIDEIMHAIDECGEKFRVWFSASDAGIKKAEETKLVSETIPRYLRQIDARLEKMQQHVTFATAQKEGRLFIHELWLYMLLESILRASWQTFVPKDIESSYTHIVACEQRVLSHPRVREWNALQQAKAKPASLKLTYFDFSGLAEPIRLALHIGGVAFEDNRIAWDDDETWDKLKPSLPYNKVPVLLIDGDVEVAQSLAILRYAGTLTGLYPSNDELLAFRIDEILSVLGQLDSVWYPSYALEMDAQTLFSERARVAKEWIDRSLGALDKRVGSWSKPYATGEQLTIADMSIFGTMMFLKSGRMEHVPKDLVDKFSNLVKIHEVVGKLPQVEAYYAARAGSEP